MDLYDLLDKKEKVSKYIRNYMPKIDGWLSQHEAAIFTLVNKIQQQKGVTGDLVDLGVWHGRSALVLYHFLHSKENLYAVDIFDLRSKDHPYYNDPEIFLSHCKAIGADEEKIKILRLDTDADPKRLASSIKRSSVRIFHVDGGHHYETAYKDIKFACKAITKEGVLACDDFMVRKFPGVTQAIIENLQKHKNLVPFAVSPKKLWICHKAQHDLYVKSITKECKAVGIKTARKNFMGNDVLMLF